MLVLGGHHQCVPVHVDTLVRFAVAISVRYTCTMTVFIINITPVALSVHGSGFTKQNFDNNINSS